MAKLTGRRDECDILDQFVDAVRGGASRALVVEGEAGVGKTALRESRRGEARDQLRTARELLDAMGMAGFAERARRELQATGETARKRVGPPADQQLTAQERQIAQLARDGMSNPRSAPGCSSARARSDTTWVTSSSSSASAHATSLAWSSRPTRSPADRRIAAPGSRDISRSVAPVDCRVGRSERGPFRSTITKT